MMFILIGIGFALYVGGNAINLCSPGVCAPGFLQMFTNFGMLNAQDLVNFILSPITSLIGGLAIVAAAVASAASGKSFSYAVGVAVMVYIANLVLLPMNFLPSVSGIIPMEIYYLLSIVINLCLMLAVLSFVLEKSW
jgi:hypothetical protein